MCILMAILGTIGAHIITLKIVLSVRTTLIVTTRPFPSCRKIAEDLAEGSRSVKKTLNENHILANKMEHNATNLD